MTGSENSWDRRYAQPDYLFGLEPNAFLVRQSAHLKPGSKALAVADGEGRNGVWLAQQGLSVLSIDNSPVGQAKARRLAESRGVTMAFEEANLETWSWPEAAFDLVAAIFIQFAPPALRARIFDGLQAALKPGGVLLLQGYRPEQIAYGTGGPAAPQNLYTEPMLRAAFAGMDILELRSHDSPIHEGKGHDGVSALIDLVARKHA